MTVDNLFIFHDKDSLIAALIFSIIEGDGFLKTINNKLTAELLKM
jgi:hypothetical protein